MKVIKCDLSPELEEIEILPLADLHIGDAECDWNLVQELLSYIKNTPNCYCILNGDLMDTAIASSIGDTYSANAQPMEQLRLCVKLFGDLAGKILAVTGGNHENRVYKSDGIDMTEMMCAQLGIPEKYSPTTALLFLRFGEWPAHRHKRKICYTIYQTHGTGGGRREGGKINRLADLSQIVDADVYICAHTHLPAVFKTGFYRTDLQNSAVANVEKLFVNTASALRYGGYGDKQGYKPASNSYPKIILSGKTKKAKAVM